MNEPDFRTYLGKLKSTKTGEQFGDRVISNIMSRCATAERKFGFDLDMLPLPPSTGKGGWLSVIDSAIPAEITGDYRSAVRKYLSFRTRNRKPS